MTNTKTILHADDVPRWRQLVQNRLAKDQFNVISVESCDAVLPRLEQGGIDLVIVDQLMPGSGEVDSGYAVVQAIRESFPNVPVLMFTGALEGTGMTSEEFEDTYKVEVVFKEDADRLQRRVAEILG